MTSAKDVARVFEYLSLQSDGCPIEVTRLNKLLYLAQGHTLAELKHALFTNQIDAWEHGPVVAVVYTGFNKIVERTKQNGLSDIHVSPEELDIIMDVWDQYRGYSATELVDLTHEPGSPWREVYQSDVKNVHIPLELIQQYFNKPENNLKHSDRNLEELPSVDALPAEEYDPEEDAVWEALLNDAR